MSQTMEIMILSSKSCSTPATTKYYIDCEKISVRCNGKKYFGL